jgi:hypothetical protein
MWKQLRTVMEDGSKEFLQGAFSEMREGVSVVSACQIVPLTLRPRTDCSDLASRLLICGFQGKSSPANLRGLCRWQQAWVLIPFQTARQMLSAHRVSFQADVLIDR